MKVVEAAHKVSEALSYPHKFTNAPKSERGSGASPYQRDCQILHTQCVWCARHHNPASKWLFYRARAGTLPPCCLDDSKYW